MVIFQILGILLWLVPVPFGLALLMLHIGRKSNRTEMTDGYSAGTVLLWGYILMFALLEIIGIPVMLVSTYHGFSNFYKIYAPCLLILSFSGIWLALRSHTIGEIARTSGKSLRTIFGETWEKRIGGLLVVLIIGFQLYMAFTRASFDGDDAYYGVQALTAQQIDTLYRINPNNGWSTPLDARHALALFPIWEAFLGTMCGIHATIVAHSVVPLVLIPLSYLIYYEIGKRLFRDKKPLVSLFLIFLSLWQMFGNVSIYTTETFFLTRTWQGKSFAGNFVLPAVFWLFLCLYSSDTDASIQKKPWFLLAALNLAAGASSSLAVLLSCLLTVGLGVLFFVKERSFCKFLYACMSCIPGGIYVLLYLAL